MRLPLLCFFIMCTIALNAQSFVGVKGKNLILNEKPFVMKGINLGNWLVPEGYMFKFKNATSPRLINEAFNELIGPSCNERFLATIFA